MATTTPNIGLTLPIGTEGWKRSVINGNFTILDTKIGAVGNTPLQTQINTLSSQLTRIYKKTITGTTSATGAIDSQLNVSTYHIISATLTTGGGTAGFVFWRGNDGYLKCFDIDMQTLANTSVSVTIVYCKNSELQTE